MEAGDGVTSGAAAAAGQPISPSDPVENAGNPGDGKKKVDLLSNDPSFFDGKTEVVYIYSDKGRLIAKIDGTEHRVDLSSIEIKDVKDAHITHNHPHSDLASDTWTFTDNDIETAVTGDFSTMTATGRYRTYTMERPELGWGNHEETIKQAKKKLKVSDKYFDDYIRYRDGSSFGDSPETLNKDAKKFWKTYAELIDAKYTEKKRRL